MTDILSQLPGFTMVGRLASTTGPAEAIPISAALSQMSALSSSSVAIGTGSKTFTVPTTSLFYVGEFVSVADTADYTKYMAGYVTSWNPTTGALVVNVQYTGGSGTIATWIIAPSSIPLLAGTFTMNGALNYATSVTIASTATVNIGAAASNLVTISGTNAVTNFDTANEGVVRIVTYSGAVPVTYDATKMVLVGGVSRTNAAGDWSIFKSNGGGNWVESFYQSISGNVSQNNPITLASTTTVAIGAAGLLNITISGSSTINSFDVAPTGALRLVKYGGAIPVTYGATSIQLLREVSRTMSSGEFSLFESLGSGNWKEVFYSDSYIIQQSTPVSTTTGTSISFTGIPSWAKRITIMLNGVGTNGTSPKLIQLGSGSFTTTGYSSASHNLSPSGVSGVNFTAGLGLYSILAVDRLYGDFTINLENPSSNSWVGKGGFGDTGGGGTIFVQGAGGVPLAGVLDRIRIATSNGTDTFVAGEINISYE